MTVQNFIEEFNQAKVVNNKLNEHAVEDWIKEKLEIKKYLPFKIKKQIVETIVNDTIDNDNGINVVRSADQFITFVMSMLTAYTNLEIEDEYEVYDALSESGMLSVIISCFIEEYNACDTLLKMEIEDRMQYNDKAVIFAEFLNNLNDKLNALNELIKDKIEGFDLQKTLGIGEDNNIGDILETLLNISDK